LPRAAPLAAISEITIRSPARYSGLVGHRNDGNSQAIASRDGSRRAFEHAHVLGTPKIVRIVDEDAVAIEKQRRAVCEIPGGDFGPEPLVRFARIRPL